MDDFYSGGDWGYSSSWDSSSHWDSYSTSHWDDHSSSHIHSSDPWDDPAWITGLRPDSPFYSSNDLTDPTNPLSPISPLNPMHRDWYTGSSSIESSDSIPQTKHIYDKGYTPYTPIGIDTERDGFWIAVIGALVLFFSLWFFT